MSHRTSDPRISFCMMVQDEEERLSALLKQAFEFVDEAIVVDTGSSDRTVAVARELGSTVIELGGFDGDYGKARNAYIEAASGDWILSLDADEMLEENDWAKAVEDIQASRAPVLVFGRLTYDGKGLWGWDTPVRAFRNSSGTRYAPGVFEEVLAQQCSPDDEVFSRALIHHYSFAAGEPEVTRKINRYYTLNRRRCSLKPEAFWRHFFCSQVAMLLGALERSRMHLRRATRLATSDVALAKTRAHSGRLHYLLGDLETSLEHTQQASELDPVSPDYRNQVGVLEYVTGNFERAASIFRSMQDEPAPYRQPPPQFLINAAYAADRLGDPEEARRLLGRVVELCPLLARNHWTRVELNSAVIPPLVTVPDFTPPVIGTVVGNGASPA
ncbi:MAG: glycosyltransferase [bacterium]|nr:glycosyltransferase [bacterium]